MVLRRAFFYWQTAAALVLPAWLLVGWAIWGESTGGLVGVAITAPLLVLALLVVVGLTIARKSVRDTRSVSWLDVGVLGVWHAMLIGLGFFGPASNWFAVFAVFAAIIAFWSAIYQLVTETRKRVRAVFDEIQRQAAGPSTSRTPIDAGEFIVLPQTDTDR